MLDFIKCLLGISLCYHIIFIILFINMRNYINVFPDIRSFLPFGLSWVLLLQGKWASCVRKEVKEASCGLWTVRRGHTRLYTVNFSGGSLRSFSTGAWSVFPIRGVLCLDK